VGVLRQTADGPRHFDGRLVLLVWLCSLAGLPREASPLPPLSPAPRGALPDRAADSTTNANPIAATGETVDVVLRPDGVLCGRVAGADAAGAVRQPAGVRVKLVQHGRTVAVAITGSRGEFHLENLSTGRCTVVVEDSGTSSWRPCRVWTTPAAPTHARRKINVLLGGPVVRGNHPSPFPIMSLQQAATVTAIGIGAIAAPAIYHNTLIDNRVPCSP